MDKLDCDRVPRGTRQTNDTWLKIAKDYFKEKEIECDFATITEIELGKHVFDKCRPRWNFIKEWRGVLEKQWVLGFRAGIHWSFAQD